MTLPFLAFTLGDPAGIGPWVAAAAARDTRVRRRCRPVLVGDAWVVRRFVSHPGLRVRPITDLDDYVGQPGTVNVLHVAHPGIHSLVLGRPQKAGGEAAGLAIRAAVALALQGRVAAVVTGPVSKESLRLAGLPFPGHTEMLAVLSGAGRVEMVMAAGDPPGVPGARPLLSVLITRHIPLKDVPAHLSREGIASSVRLTDRWIRRFLGFAPRWALCGLNPHAGDNGLLGMEEKRLARPAADMLRRAGVRVDGPLPADVAWARHAAGDYDAVACLYHDQAMIPLKTLQPKGVVNITAGLPWIRTSPGHGTAFDLARGRRPYAEADPSATIQAALWALRIADGKVGPVTRRLSLKLREKGDGEAGPMARRLPLKLRERGGGEAGPRPGRRASGARPVLGALRRRLTRLSSKLRVEGGGATRPPVSKPGRKG